MQLFFCQKAPFCLEKQLQIENSGFVKTCDEHVPSGIHGIRSKLLFF